MSCSSNQEPRFLATVTGQTSVDSTLMQLMLTFASCCLVPTIKNSVLSSLYRYVETPVSKRVRTSELNSGMNVIEISTNIFKRSGPPVKIMKISSIYLHGVSESVSFEHTKKKAGISDLRVLYKSGRAGAKKDLW